MHRALTTGLRTLAVIALSGALTATAAAQTSGDDGTTSSKIGMERIVIVMPDGSRTVRWVRKSSSTAGQQRGGIRLSAPPGMNGGDDGGAISLDGPFMPRGDNERKAPQSGGVVGIPLPPPGGNGGGGGGGGGGDGGGSGGGGFASGEIIYPGGGFSGPTPQPSNVGGSADYGYTAKAIARWDVVPFQEFDNTFNIGVVAFHMAGIDRVDFIAEGGTPVPIGEPTLNPRTGVVEYWATLQASDFQDGATEIRAIAYPLSGEPRVLDSLTLFPNHHGGLETVEVFVDPVIGDDDAAGTRNAPYASMARALIQFKWLVTPEAVEGPAASGFITLLREGDYYMPSHIGKWSSSGPYVGPMNVRPERWITIRPDAGVNGRECIMGQPTRENMRYRSQRLRFQDVSIDLSTINQIYTEGEQEVWFDGARIWNPDGWTASYAIKVLSPTRSLSFGGRVFSTDTEASDWVYGLTNHAMVRNCYVHDISGDALQNSTLVLNTVVDNIDGTVSTHHSDLLQYFGHHENMIIYGVKATNLRETQNIFLDHYLSSFTNCAFVNIMVENLNEGAPFTQLNSHHDHVLFYHISNPMQRWFFRDDFSGDRQFVANNVVFRNNVVEAIQRGVWQWTGLPPNVEMTNTHFVDDQFAHGDNMTIGDITLVDQAGVGFSYTGPSVGMITDSGLTIPDLYIPDWTYGDPTTPNRGAYPFSEDYTAGN